MNVQDMLKAYVDGELTAAERVSVEDAAAKDPAIREEIQWIQSLSKTLKTSVPSFEIKGKQETLAALRQKKPAKVKSGVWLGGLSMAAVAGIAFFALTQGSNSDRASYANLVATSKRSEPMASSSTQENSLELRSSTKSDPVTGAAAEAPSISTDQSGFRSNSERNNRRSESKGNPSSPSITSPSNAQPALVSPPWRMCFTPVLVSISGRGFCWCALWVEPSIRWEPAWLL